MFDKLRKRILPGASKGDVLVLGDSITDVWIEARPNGFAQEAPVPRYACTDRWTCCVGGAENVVKNLRGLGVKVRAVLGWPSCMKYRLMACGHAVLRFDEDYVQDPVEVTVEEVQQYDAVVISDYNKGSIDGRVLEIVAAAKVPAFIDCRGFNGVEVPEWLRKQAFWFPNHQEYQSNYNRHDGLGVAYSQCNKLLITQGENGARLVNNHPVDAVQPVDAYKPGTVKSVCGAGDAVVAGFVAAKLQGKNDYTAAIAAMQVASCAITQPYTASTTLAEVRKQFGKESVL
jgi:bifunctional ADP-heptose synthase (sugar kinase/adenylyltransferase)